MDTLIWGTVLIAAVWAAHWGAAQLGEPLSKLRSQLGLTQVAGAALVGLAAASPEIGISTTSALKQVADIGLGTMLGSNIIAIPLVVTTAYVASRKAQLSKNDQDNVGKSIDEHRRHRRQKFMRIEKEAVTVQAIPYIGIVAIVALLTLPAPWRGLQPIDGWIVMAVYSVYLAQALLRGRQSGEPSQWTTEELLIAIAGVLALAIGAYSTTTATENIVANFGISEVIGGLFITALVAALPEIFATWSITQSGQITTATASVIGDHAVTMTMAFFPLALVGVPISNLPLFSTNLLFAGLVPIAFAAFIHWGGLGHGILRWQVLALDSLILIYLATVLIGVLKVF